MKIPKRLKIGGHIFKIEMVLKGSFNDINTFGECSPEDNLIKIRKDIPKNQIEECLLHEILHAINWQMTELEIESLSQQLYQVIKDNRLIFFE